MVYIFYRKILHTERAKITHYRNRGKLGIVSVLVVVGGGAVVGTSGGRNVARWSPYT